MKITLKPVLWLKDVDKDGQCPIAISIAGGGKRTYYNTKIKVLPKYWKQDKIIKGQENYDVLNTKLQELLNNAKRDILNKELQGEKITIDEAKELFNPTRKNTGGDFIKFYRKYIDSLIATNKKKPATIAIWETEYSQFSEFVGGSISFRDITTEKLNEYHETLLKYEYTTIHKKLKKLLQIVTRAIKMEHITPKQIIDFEMIRYIAPETDYLTLSELQAISNDLYNGKHDGNDTLRLVTAFFLVGSYSALRFSDWHKFKVEKLIHKRNFKVTTTKTNKPVYLPLDKFPSLAKIVDYISENNLVFSLSEGKTNEYLKLLKTGLTTHDGRRTFATLHGELGYTTRWIAKVMAVSERTAMGYIKATEQGFDNEISKNGGL